jgi:hypothetical protein
MDQTSQKIAILKRLREMLQRQREKFQAYLTLLEQQESSIRNDEPEKLLAQAEMEQSIIAEIFTLKKVIEPLETLYQAAYPLTESTVPRLKATLETMAQQVFAHNASNRHLLKTRMNDLRQEISSLRSWPKSVSPFAEVVPSLVDITT